jgi:hypothetical protein
MCTPRGSRRSVATVFPLLAVAAPARQEGDSWWFSIEVEPDDAGTRLALYARNVSYDDRIIDRFFTVGHVMVRGDVAKTPAVVQYPLPAAGFVGVKSGERLRLGEITVKHAAPPPGARDDTVELVIGARTPSSRLRLQGDVVVPHLGR